MFEYVLLSIPVIFLVASVYYAYKNVSGRCTSGAADTGDRLSGHNILSAEHATVCTGI